MPTDPLDVIAASYRGIHESTQRIAQATERLDATQTLLHATLRGVSCMQGIALVMLGIMLLLLSGLGWIAVTEQREHAVHTQALLELVQRIRIHP